MPLMIEDKPALERLGALATTEEDGPKYIWEDRAEWEVS